METRRQPQPSKSELNRLYASLRRRPHVIACFLGFKYSKRRRRRTISIVCLVSKKVGSRALSPRARIPKRVSWRDSLGRRHEIATDVVLVRAAGKLVASTAGPGDKCVAAERGSVGFAMHHPQLGKVVTTAGHCALRPDEGPGTYDFSQQPRVARLTNIAAGASEQGEILKAVCTILFDHALVRPEDPERCTNFYRSGFRVKEPLATNPQLGDAVTLLTSMGNAKSAIVIGVHAEAPLGKAGLLLRCILTTPILVGGDSGGLLITANREALGLAVGFVPVAERRVISVFVTARSVLRREGAAFI